VNRIKYTILPYNLDNLAVLELSIKETMVHARMTGYVDCLVKEVSDIWLHPNNFNRDRIFTQSQCWNIATNIFQCLKKATEEGSTTSSFPNIHSAMTNCQTPHTVTYWSALGHGLS
jgi:hypothetical protein